MGILCSQINASIPNWNCSTWDLTLLIPLSQLNTSWANNVEVSPEGLVGYLLSNYSNIERSDLTNLLIPQLKGSIIMSQIEAISALNS